MCQGFGAHTEDGQEEGTRVNGCYDIGDHSWTRTLLLVSAIARDTSRDTSRAQANNSSP